MGMIDEQYKDYKLREALKKIEMLEKIIELHNRDLHYVVEQRDWYYDRYMHYKKASSR